jgi:hypothetical protein
LPAYNFIYQAGPGLCGLLPKQVQQISGLPLLPVFHFIDFGKTALLTDFPPRQGLALILGGSGFDNITSLLILFIIFKEVNMAVRCCQL